MNHCLSKPSAINIDSHKHHEKVTLTHAIRHNPNPNHNLNIDNPYPNHEPRTLKP